MIRLVIKGTPREAIAAARAHGVRIVKFITESSGSTYVDAPESEEERVRSWFGSGGRVTAPYTSGELLYFSTGTSVNAVDDFPLPKIGEHVQIWDARNRRAADMPVLLSYAQGILVATPWTPLGKTFYDAKDEDRTWRRRRRVIK